MLVNVKDGCPVWAEQFDDKFTDLFTVEDSISQKVAKALTLKLTAEEQQRMAKRYTENAEAYQEYLKGRFYFLQFTPDGFTQAVTHLDAAIAMDPTSALAYAGLADAHTTASDWLLAPREALAKAKTAAEKALSFDETLAEAHAALGHVKVHELDPAAEQDLQRALELNPNSVTTLFWYAEFLMGSDLAKAIATLRRAQELDPLSFNRYLHIQFVGREPAKNFLYTSIR
jgi:Tfp pilus assembly protein PilF